jgi:hypothetical protein
MPSPSPTRRTVPPRPKSEILSSHHEPHTLQQEEETIVTQAQILEHASNLFTNVEGANTEVPSDTGLKPVPTTKQFLPDKYEPSVLAEEQNLVTEGPTLISWKSMGPSSSSLNKGEERASSAKGTMSLTEAQEIINESVSLKERMAIFQGNGGPGPTHPPPLPKTKKPTWKPPPKPISSPLLPEEKPPVESEAATVESKVVTVGSKVVTVYKTVTVEYKTVTVESKAVTVDSSSFFVGTNTDSVSKSRERITAWDSAEQGGERITAWGSTEQGGERITAWDSTEHEGERSGVKEDPEEQDTAHRQRLNEPNVRKGPPVIAPKPSIRRPGVPKKEETRPGMYCVQKLDGALLTIWDTEVTSSPPIGGVPKERGEFRSEGMLLNYLYFRQN